MESFIVCPFGRSFGSSIGRSSKHKTGHVANAITTGSWEFCHWVALPLAPRLTILHTVSPASPCGTGFAQERD